MFSVVRALSLVILLAAACAPGAPGATVGAFPGATTRAPSASPSATASPSPSASASACPAIVALRQTREGLARADVAMKRAAASSTLEAVKAAAQESTDAVRSVLPNDDAGPPGGPVISIGRGAGGRGLADFYEIAINDVSDWQQPSVRYAGLRDAVASWTPNNDTLAALPGRLLRVLGWAQLIARTTDTATAVSLAKRAVTDTDLASTAARGIALVVSSCGP